MRAAIIFAILIGLSLAEMQITVCPRGCSYSTVQSAIDAANPGGELIVHGLAGQESLFIGKQLSLEGLVAEGRRPVLMGEDGSIAILSAPGTILKGFDFEVAGQPKDKASRKDCSILIVSSQDNLIYLNNFPTSNSICANGSSFWNSSLPIRYQYNSKIFSRPLGNYWGDYTGSDVDEDGVGDQPKEIDANNIDYYPLMQPSERYAIAGDRFVSEAVISTRLNQAFNISMESNPTTGYTWTVDYDFDFLRLDISRYEGSQPGAVGSGGQQVFVFTPLREGKTTVSAVYKRPWENIVADKRAFKIIIFE